MTLRVPARSCEPRNPRCASTIPKHRQLGAEAEGFRTTRLAADDVREQLGRSGSPVVYRPIV